MTTPSLHATAVAIDGEALLILGPSRAGKSRLAVALIARATRARPIVLVGDDRIVLGRRDRRLVARPHPRIAGFIERRGLGIVAMDWVAEAPVGGVVELCVAGRDLPSPLAGEGARRADEGSSPEWAPALGPSLVRRRPLIRRFAPPSPARGEGTLRHVPRLSLAPADADADHVLAWWAGRGAGATHRPHSAAAADRPCAKD